MVVEVGLSYLYFASSSPCTAHPAFLVPEVRDHASHARDHAAFVLPCSSQHVVGLVELAHRASVLRCCARGGTWAGRNGEPALREAADCIVDDWLHPVRSEVDAATAGSGHAQVSRAEFASAEDGRSAPVGGIAYLRASVGPQTARQGLKAARVGIQFSVQAHDLCRDPSCENLCHGEVHGDHEDDTAHSNFADLQVADARDVHSGFVGSSMSGLRFVSASAHCDQKRLFVVQYGWCEGVG